MSGSHRPLPHPVGRGSILVRSQVRMLTSYSAATPEATTDPHPVLSYSRSRHGRQLGNISQVYPFLSQLLATPGAALQGHGYVHWRMGDFFRRRGVAGGEG